ncbi:MAG: hypothetical protein IKI95_08985 [Clostridia bacterium]|nr:hypothetical protein [Clostridia bacterium]
MEIDIINFAENVCGAKLTSAQKELLNSFYKTYKNGERIYYCPTRLNGIRQVMNIYNSYIKYINEKEIKGDDEK